MVFQLAFEQGDRFGVVVLLADQILLVQVGQRGFIAGVDHEAVAGANPERDGMDAQRVHHCARHVACRVGQNGCLLHIIVLLRIKRSSVWLLRIHRTTFFT
ncbi:hypothetical protein D3C86_1028310 [compost metagenome]